MSKINVKEKIYLTLTGAVIIVVLIASIIMLIPSSTTALTALATPSLRTATDAQVIQFGKYIVTVEAIHDRQEQDGFVFVYTWKIGGVDQEVDTNRIDFVADTEGTFVITCAVIAKLDGYKDSEPAIFMLTLDVESDTLNPPTGGITITPKD